MKLSHDQKDCIVEALREMLCDLDDSEMYADALNEAEHTMHCNDLPEPDKEAVSEYGAELLNVMEDAIQQHLMKGE